MAMSAIRRAVQLFDSQVAFAKAIGCRHPQQVSAWLRTDLAPARRCAAIEAACRARAAHLLAIDPSALTEAHRSQLALLGDGIPTCTQLRPDVFPVASGEGR